MFYNISNHPSSKWGVEQLEAANSHGDIRDIQFPNVPSTASYKEVEEMAENLVAQVEAGSVVMCQGEFSLTYATTRRLLYKGCRVVVACTERKVQERAGENGEVMKTSVFSFAQFREIF